MREYSEQEGLDSKSHWSLPIISGVRPFTEASTERQEVTFGEHVFFVGLTVFCVYLCWSLFPDAKYAFWLQQLGKSTDTSFALVTGSLFALAGCCFAFVWWFPKFPSWLVQVALFWSFVAGGLIFGAASYQPPGDPIAPMVAFGALGVLLGGFISLGLDWDDTGSSGILVIVLFGFFGFVCTGALLFLLEQFLGKMPFTFWLLIGGGALSVLFGMFLAERIFENERVDKICKLLLSGTFAGLNWMMVLRTVSHDFQL